MFKARVSFAKQIKYICIYIREVERFNFFYFLPCQSKNSLYICRHILANRNTLNIIIK